MGYNCCFFLNFVPLHIESLYNFGGTGPILGVKNPLQRVNGHADMEYIFVIEEFEDTKGVIRIRKSKDRQHNGEKKKDERTNNTMAKRRRMKGQTTIYTENFYMTATVSIGYIY
jgi:hypothetical protein